MSDMLPRVLTETVIDTTGAASLLGVDPVTIRRWMAGGVRGVKLEAVRVGSTWKTSKEAVARFIAGTQPGAGVNTIVSPARLKREADAARAKLRKLRATGLAGRSGGC